MTKAKAIKLLGAGCLALFAGLALMAMLQDAYKPLHRSYVPQATRKGQLAISLTPGAVQFGPQPAPELVRSRQPEYTGLLALYWELQKTIGLTGVILLIGFLMGMNIAGGIYWYGQLRTYTQAKRARNSPPQMEPGGASKAA